MTRNLPDLGNQIQAALQADPEAAEAASILQGVGGNVFVVGGAIRDIMLGKKPKDVDLMVSGLAPQQIEEALQHEGKVDITGKSFGVYRFKNVEGSPGVEIALPRSEKSTGAGHKDFEVQADYNLPPEEDLSRRDFTANAMAYNLATGQLLDPFGGAQDIQNGVLRSVRPEALSEDPLRVLRALAAASKNGLMPDAVTMEQMRANAASLEHLPRKRIIDELDKILGGSNPRAAMELAYQTGILQHVLPEVEQTMGYDQKNPHHEQELGDHILSVMERVKRIAPQDKDLALAALFHDVGKPASRWSECKNCGNQVNGPQDTCEKCGSPMVGHFYKKWPTGLGENHEDVGADMARQRMTALEYPNSRIDRVEHLVKHHMYSPFTSEKGARKFINRVGDQHADDLLRLRWADQGGKTQYPTRNDEFDLGKEAQLLKQVRTQAQPTKISQLAVNGNDLIQAGVPQGPQIGVILKSLLQSVLEDPTLNTRESLISMAQNLIQPEEQPPAPPIEGLDGPTLAKIASIQSQHSGEINQPGHQLWFRPRPNATYEDEPGRGFIHTPTQTVHTWPESESEHDTMARAKGFNPQDCVPLYIRPNGVINRIYGDSDLLRTVFDADPSLAKANGFVNPPEAPMVQALRSYMPDPAPSSSYLGAYEYPDDEEEARNRDWANWEPPMMPDRGDEEEYQDPEEQARRNVPQPIGFNDVFPGGVDENGYIKGPPPVPPLYPKGSLIRYHEPIWMTDGMEGMEPVLDENGNTQVGPNHGEEGVYKGADRNFPGLHFVDFPSGMNWAHENNIRPREGEADPTWNEFWHGANILDPIQKTLDPTVFVAPESPKPQMHPHINRWIHDTIYDILERHGYEGPRRWLTLVLTGSLTTYQYSDVSDCDISLFINSKVFPEWSRAEMIGIMVKEFDGVLLPGTTHDIQAFVVSEKLKPKDLYRPGLRSGLDLDTNKWIVPPNRHLTHDVEHEMNVAYTYALEVCDKMDRLLKFEPNKAKRYYEILHGRRQKDQATGRGDFSESNIAYKALANHGYFNKLRDLGVQIA